MGLCVGIVGLPNVGKSTLFNALTRTQNAQAANYPFCTIDSNLATVGVNDARLSVLARLTNPERIVPATVDMVDIAGLVRGASRGEGLGNQFLANIREVDAILHVVRCFEHEDVVHVEGEIDPLRDSEIVNIELILADLQTVEKREDRLRRQARADPSLREESDRLARLHAHLVAGQPARTFQLAEGDRQRLFREMPLLTTKPVIYCANVGEKDLDSDTAVPEAFRKAVSDAASELIVICAGVEAEMALLDGAERDAFLDAYGLARSGIDVLVEAAYQTLGLISFLTAGPKEVRAWTVRRGARAAEAAGVIHSDFERGFIRAQVISFADYEQYGSEIACKQAGRMRQEGREYVVQDGDVIHFLFNV